MKDKADRNKEGGRFGAVEGGERRSEQGVGEQCKRV